MRCEECGMKECCGAELGPEIERLRETINELKKQMSPRDARVEVPDTPRLVLVRYKTPCDALRVTTGFYCHKHQLEEPLPEHDDLDMDYDESTDTFYIPEGWYENVEQWDDFSFLEFNDTVLYWQELPPAPEEK